MSSFGLKIIAIISMLIDHTAYALYGGFSFWNYLGRLAFPIFAFQIAQGYQHTSNLKKYFLRLFVFAILSQIPFSFFLYTITGEFLTLNIFFTLTLGLLSIFVFEKSPSKFLGFLFCAFCAFVASFLHMDYGYYGVLVIFLFYLFRDHKKIMVASFLFLTILRYIPVFFNTNFYYPNIILCICTCLSIIPILFYNGTRGKKMTYFFYLFYPCHLALLTLLCFFIAI